MIERFTYKETGVGDYVVLELLDDGDIEGGTFAAYKKVQRVATELEAKQLVSDRRLGLLC